MDLRSTIPCPWLVCRCVSSGRGVVCPSRPSPPFAPSTATTFPLINQSNSIKFDLAILDLESIQRDLSPTSDKRPRTPDPTSTPPPTSFTSIPRSLSQVRITHSFLTKHERNPSAQQQFAIRNSNRPNRSHQTRSNRNQISHEP
jgi:hypothetical protein